MTNNYIQNSINSTQQVNPFQNLSPEVIKYNYELQGYITDDTIINAVYAALITSSPILVDGPAGVGKTELAKVTANMLKANMLRLQCYHGIGVNEVLYEMDEAKISSYSILLGKHVESIVHGKTWEAAVDTVRKEKFFESEEFLIKRPVLKAIAPDDSRYQLLLIDEIDKASEKIEALLLETLAEYSISVPEIGRTYTCTSPVKPVIFLTSNNVRELGEPLRRRCAYLYIDYPKLEVEQKIISLKANVSMDYALSAAKMMNDIRQRVKMKKLPCNSEAINFFSVLYHHLNVQVLDLDVYGKIMAQAVSLLAKYQSDVEELKKYFIRS